MIKQKESRMVFELGIFPRSISKVGNHYIGHNSRAAYVWHKGEVTELVPGFSIQHESISADEVERITGMKFAGTHEDTGETVFMSKSNAVTVGLVPAIPDSHFYDIPTAYSAAQLFASQSQKVFDVLEASVETDGVSESAVTKYAQYKGPKQHFDDASDEYDLEIEKGDWIRVTYLNKDRYELRLKDSPRVQFILRGHARVQNIVGYVDYTLPFGQVSENKKDKYNYVGSVPKIMRDPYIAKGTAVYEKRKKHYFAQNLGAPIENFLKAGEISNLLNILKQDPEAKSIVAGKLVGAAKLPKLANPEKVKTSSKKLDKVYGAYFAVSPSAPNRSRVIYADTPEKVQEEARSIISAMSTPVDYNLFTTFSTDENYATTQKNKVVIRSTPLLAAKYPTAQTVKMAVAVNHPEFVEPKNGAPALHIPAHEGKTSAMYDYFRRLITEGYFGTGVRLAMNQPDTGIRFAAPAMDDITYDQIVGTARRITAYLKHNGAPLKQGSVRIARGKKVAEIRFNFPKLPAEGIASLERMRTDFPKFNTPIYETIKPKQPTVEITAVDIHTGKVTVRAQRGSNLYGAPFQVYYSNVIRKNFG